MISRLRIPETIALLLVAACARCAHAQNIVNWNVPSGDWAVASNWDTGNLPDTGFDELANISNGGTATVSSPVSVQPGQVVLGELAGQSGTLNIANGGSLTVAITGGNASNAAVEVGRAGTGHLVVQPG